MPRFIAYNTVSSLFQGDDGEVMMLDRASVLTHKEVLDVLTLKNSDGQQIIPINFDAPSMKPDQLEAKLNCRVYAFRIRKKLMEYGFGKNYISLDEIKDAFKRRVSLEEFINEDKLFMQANTLTSVLMSAGIR